jgi:hypothetical protein
MVSAVISTMTSKEGVTPIYPSETMHPHPLTWRMFGLLQETLGG